MSEPTGPLSLDDIFAADTEGLLDQPEKAPVLTGQDRLQRSFQEINDYIAEHGKEPDPTVHAIQERRLGARLEGIRANPEKIATLEDLDEHGLLTNREEPEALSLDDILALGDDILDDATGILDTSTLPARIKRSEPDWIAKRRPAPDFEQFKHLFTTKQEELRSGAAGLSPNPREADIKEGVFFVLSGMLLFIAEVGQTEIVAGRRKERLRVIFENGTQSSMYRQSLTSRLHEDDSFLVTQKDITLTQLEPEDQLSGHLYVLRSLSTHPEVTSRPNLHKIGFTRHNVKKRIANAERETTYLMAPVEIVADYRTYNLKASVLEHLLHVLFAHARIPFEQIGLTRTAAEASEWFDVPLETIDHAINLVTNETITNWQYDMPSGKLRPTSHHAS